MKGADLEQAAELDSADALQHAHTDRIDERYGRSEQYVARNADSGVGILGCPLALWDEKGHNGIGSIVKC